MIRVAHVITNLASGGAEMILYRMLQVMHGSRFKAEAFSLKQEHPVGDRIAELDVRLRALHISRIPSRCRAPSAVVASWAVWRGEDMDDLVGGLAAKLAGRRPVAWRLHVGQLDRRTHGARRSGLHG